MLRQSFIQEDCRLRFGELELDTVEKKVYKQGEVLELARKEYAILEYLMRRAPAVVSSEELIEHVWDSEADLFSNSLKSHIYNLKKKLLPLQYIQNVRKMGYALEVKL